MELLGKSLKQKTSLAFCFVMSLFFVVTIVNASVEHYDAPFHWNYMDWTDGFDFNNARAYYLDVVYNEVDWSWEMASWYCHHNSNDDEWWVGDVVSIHVYVSANDCSGGSGTYVWVLNDGDENGKSGVWIPNGWTGWFYNDDAYDCFYCGDGEYLYHTSFSIKVSNEATSGELTIDEVHCYLNWDE